MDGDPEGKRPEEQQARAGAEAAPGLSLHAVGALLLAVYIPACLAWLQWTCPHLLDWDSYFHARFANFVLPNFGFLKEFPWTQESLWRSAYSDKETLYHLVLAPFCRSAGDVGLIAGAKLAALCLGSAVFLAFYMAARGIGLARPALWTFVFFSVGPLFLYRMLEVRAHVLSVLLTIASVPLLVGGRTRWLFGLGFVYAWSYAAPHLVVCLALVYAVFAWVGGAPFRWGGALAAAAGVLAGLAIHPHAPNSFRMWEVQNVTVLTRAWGLGADAGLWLGGEFDAASTREILGYAAGLPAAWLAAAGALALGGRVATARTHGLLGLAAAGTGLLALSVKFVEYAAPLTVLFAASALEGALGEGWRARARAAGRRGGVTLAAGIACLAALHGLCLATTHAIVRRDTGPYQIGAAAWVREHVPTGTVVMNLNWDDFPILFFYDPLHFYLVGLDPSFHWVVDAEGARWLEETRLGRRPFDARELARRFKGEYGILSKLDAQARLAEEMRAGRVPGAELVYEDSMMAVFRVIP
ncbi:MAG: hypothetical protein HZA54_08995 [Planctomycetes bacterium]|nr:hypothetical protein [Planctomycetota bacterium]